MGLGLEAESLVISLLPSLRPRGAYRRFKLINPWPRLRALERMLQTTNDQSFFGLQAGLQTTNSLLNLCATLGCKLEEI